MFIISAFHTVLSVLENHLLLYIFLKNMEQMFWVRGIMKKDKICVDSV